MAIKGSLKEAGLADICQLLSIGLKTGSLSITDRSRFGQIFFDRGRITFATIVNRRDRLGDLLVRDGAITHAQLAEVVDEQARQPDRRLGEILLERGYIDGDTLTACVRTQIEEAIYYLFTWTRGDFYFEPGRMPEPGEIAIALSAETLLLEGARRIDEWAAIEKRISSLDLIFNVDRDWLSAAQVPLTPEQRAILPFIDGQRSVHGLAEAAGLGEFDTGKALFGLIQAGFATRVGRRDASSDIETDDFHDVRKLGAAFYRAAMLDDADREFRRVCQSDPHDPVARHYLALLALRRGDAADAADRLASLMEAAGPGPAVCLNLALALRLDHRFDDAARVLAQAEEIAPEDPRVALARAVNTLMAGDATAAAAGFDRYRRMLRPDAIPQPMYFYFAALAAAVDARLEDADALVDEGLAAHAACAPLLLLRGNVAELRVDTTAAEVAYRHAAEEDPKLPQSHRNLGDMALRRNAAQEATEHYRRATELDPDLGDEVYVRLADLFRRRNDLDRAVRCWRKAIEVNPGNEVARDHLEAVVGASR